MYASSLNSDLEKLREEVLQPLNFKTIILNINQIASQIHVAYLFENEGKKLLQKLCLLLSATALGKSYGDWQKFAAFLGLINEQIKCIDYNFKGLQDPTYYVLLTFAQSDDATIDKIFLVLEKIERLDIVQRVLNCFDDLLYNLASNKNSIYKNGIFKPISLPKAPLVLSQLVENQQKGDKTFLSTPCNTVISNIKKKTNDQKYGSIIMLTFAEDGYTTAELIAKLFRSQEPKIGVVILQEQEKHVYSKAEEFIDNCFKQVNYIVPILTEGYLFKVNHVLHDEINNLDSKYVRYIFSLVRYEYIKDDCINNRVRCIVPDNQIKKISSLVLHPTLQAWFKESDVNLFAERILLQKF